MSGFRIKNAHKNVEPQEKPTVLSLLDADNLYLTHQKHTQPSGPKTGSEAGMSIKTVPVAVSTGPKTGSEAGMSVKTTSSSQADFY
jgi:hypothetical protein